GFDETEPARLARELGVARGRSDEPRQLRVLSLKLPHLGRALHDRLTRVEIRTRRLVVEKPDDRDCGHRDPHAPRPPPRSTRSPTLRHAASVRGAGARSYAVSTLITFVEPAMLTWVPAVITTRSPDCTRPASRADSIERLHRSSTFGCSEIHSG